MRSKGQFISVSAHPETSHHQCLPSKSSSLSWSGNENAMGYNFSIPSRSIVNGCKRNLGMNRSASKPGCFFFGDFRVGRDYVPRCTQYTSQLTIHFHSHLPAFGCHLWKSQISNLGIRRFGSNLWRPKQRKPQQKIQKAMARWLSDPYFFSFLKPWFKTRWNITTSSPRIGAGQLVLEPSGTVAEIMLAYQNWPLQSENPLEILLKWWCNGKIWETHLEMKDVPLLCLITKWPFCFCGWIQWSENVGMECFSGL